MDRLHKKKVITIYNNQEHRSLGETTPNKVVKDTKTQDVIKTINEEKEKKNTIKSSLKVGDRVKKNMFINESYAKGTDPKWSEKIFTVSEVKGQWIRLNDGTYYLDDNLLKVPETATDAETNVVNKVKTDQRKEHKSKPAPQKKTETIQPNPVDEYIREMARQADEEAQKTKNGKWHRGHFSKVKKY